ncbi:MAG: protein Mom, partial [Acidobacteriota bacterium]
MQNLRLDFCSHQAAKHAVLRWHYSRAMPAAKLVRIGVWEDGRFSGVILYGSGANRHLASPFGLEPT